MKKVLIAAVLMGLAGGAYAADFGDLGGASAAGLKALAAAEGFAVPDVDKGYVDPAEFAVPIEWVAIPGGKFTMGTSSVEPWFANAKPAHEVYLKSFEMAKTAVTVEQYDECVINGACTAPGTGEYCNWRKSGRRKHPVNCVDWAQAQAYARFKGARLPSEAEFEYAATSGGKNQKYPWGNQEPTGELAVFHTFGTMPVCSKPKGNTEQGLCDMAGNVGQWVQDLYQNSYRGVPADGSAFEAAGSFRVIRGGSFANGMVSALRSDYRSRDPGRTDDIGFRLVR